MTRRSQKKHRSAENLGTSNQLQKRVEFKSIFAGPLPSPADFQGYESVLPGSAERILSLTERQSAHRMSLEQRVVNSGIKQSWVGQAFAFIIAMTTIIGGVICILDGKDVGGIASILAVLTSLVFVFLAGRKQNKKNPNK
ncbi:MAG TPA: DUF2335 domain-containing protein [Spirochaetota bacterium]|nr:DUF2335 domain-containing protein [Spirochaetota bacterium]